MNPKVYIITGPIGSGKSTVCAYLKKKGNLTIDLDILSNNILESQESLPFLKSNFKNCFTDGKINRKLIAEIVFKDKVKLKILEEYLHPLVSEEIAKIINHSETDIFIEVSAPKNIHKIYPSLVIIANEGVRRERLKNRGMSHNDIENRIKTQPNEEWWRSLGTVIENDELSELEQKLDNILNLNNE